MQEQIIRQSIERAKAWVQAATAVETRKDMVFQQKVAKMLDHPEDKLLFMELLDQSFRAKNPARALEQFKHILGSHSEASFLTSLERVLMAMLRHLGPILPSLAVTQVIRYIRQETADVVIHGEEGPFTDYLAKRKNEQIQTNVNFIGEAVLGEEEAERRMQKYIRALEGDSVSYISVKISTIFSQIDSLAFEWTLEQLESKLTRLYTAAAKGGKFVNLDMEEYRDVELTINAFMRTLDRPKFKGLYAGIVLQAYLPDTHRWQQRLTEWAMERVKNGGSPVKVRIVKGANMEMEQCEASIENWEMVTFDQKSHTDANYKKMLDYALMPEHIEAVRIGVASHNLFDIAYAYEVAEQNGVLPHIIFEMLEGIAVSSQKVIKQEHGDILLYAPVAAKEEFVNAIAYLVRRLDENTAEENFLRHAFGLKVGSSQWDLLQGGFERSHLQKSEVRDTPKRTQDRRNESHDLHGSYETGEFANDPATDWSLPANRLWADEIITAWDFRQRAPLEAAIVLDGETITERDKVTAYDHAYPDKQVTVGTFPLATDADVEQAVAVAKADPEGWRKTTRRERHALISEAAKIIHRERGNLMGIAAAECGKVFKECDIEISEAIDFAQFYPRSLEKLEALKTVQSMPKGVGVVITPWNFPVAIPAGGIISALITGNTVIVKPASAAALTAYQLCQCFWEAGISKKVLQFMPCRGEGAGETLSTHKDVDFVIFTGGTDAAMRILKKNPTVHISAETGGKNATIVTAMADRDLAIKNVLHSAFSNVGQKCSATSLLILEKEVYDDPAFKSALVDAARSMPVGSPWELQSRIGPLIQPPKGDLKNAIEILEPGESWALQPATVDNNPYLISPGIKWDVQAGNFCHTHELFGPVIAVMRAENLEHAIEMVNATGYGLTSGLESLDEREHAVWRDAIRAGNLYINRSTTGAIVLRQPFGGMGKSAIGAGIKAGGWNYVTQFVTFSEGETIQREHEPDSALARTVAGLDAALFHNETATLDRLAYAIASYEKAYREHFTREVDYVGLRGEENLQRYLPRDSVLLRLRGDETLFDILAVVSAVKIAKIPLHVAMTPSEGDRTHQIERLLSSLLDESDTVSHRDDASVAGMLSGFGAIRYIGEETISREVFDAAAASGRHIHANRPVSEGRIELINYFVEQSITYRYHRYGNLGKRGE